jgi:hypothetical protein
LETHIKILESAISKSAQLCKEFTAKAPTTKLLHRHDENQHASQELTVTFVDWARRNGIKFHDLAIAEFEGFGRGLAAIHDIPEDTVVLEVPEHMLINVHRIQDSEALAPLRDEMLQLDPDDALVLYVIYEKNVNPNSFWKPYLDMLPESFDSMALGFNLQELTELEGISLLDEVLAAKEHVRMLHDQVCGKYIFPFHSN